MAYVRQHRDAGGAVVPAVWDRVPTEGDASRFVNAETGYRQILHIGDTSQLPNGTLVVAEEATLGAHIFQLNFDYIVGANQLEVLIPNSDRYAANIIEFIQIPSVAERNVAAQGWTGPPAAEMATYFEEIGSSTVRVYGVPDPPGVVLFRVPHTSLPAASRNKVIVLDQGDNEAIELRGDGDGVLFRSPNGSKWLFRVDDNGTPVVEPR